MTVRFNKWRWMCVSTNNLVFSQKAGSVEPVFNLTIFLVYAIIDLGKILY